MSWLGMSILLLVVYSVLTVVYWSAMVHLDRGDQTNGKD